MFVLLLRKFQAATAAAENHTDSAPLIHGQRFRIELCVCERLPRSHECEGRCTRNVGAFLGVKKLIRVDPADFARDLNRKLRRIKS